MSLDLSKLENVRERGARILAACPACREAGADRKGEHLVIYGNGQFACIVNTGEAGREHRRRIFELAGEAESRPLVLTHYFAQRKPVCVAAPRVTDEAQRSCAVFPPMRTPTAEELREIARVRGWPTAEGLDVLVARGMLFSGAVWDGGREWPAWIVTDSTRRNAQARRMDGQVWEGIGGAKAKSLRGTSAGRCIGACTINEHTAEVWLVEGTPDLLAAAILAKRAGLDLETLALVCVTGAGPPLHPQDLPHFVGKPVTIAVHNDTDHGAGAKAATQWGAQLRRAGAGRVRGFYFAGHACKDLSDYIAATAQTKESVMANAAKTNTPRGLCPDAWARGILAPIGGPTALGAAYVWRNFTAEQIASDATLGLEDG